MSIGFVWWPLFSSVWRTSARDMRTTTSPVPVLTAPTSFVTVVPGVHLSGSVNISHMLTEPSVIIAVSNGLSTVSCAVNHANVAADTAVTTERQIAIAMTSFLFFLMLFFSFLCFHVCFSAFYVEPPLSGPAGQQRQGLGFRV
ncbi:MAG: hypothetical protein FWF08_02980 [Oscillospiraceae bacterium]|nr:hypothetical protein [Oscillospiraceae bacterium]